MNTTEINNHVKIEDKVTFIFKDTDKLEIVALYELLDNIVGLKIESLDNKGNVTKTENFGIDSSYTETCIEAEKTIKK